MSGRCLLRPVAGLAADRPPHRCLMAASLTAVVGAHGGRVWAESPPAGGVRFVVDLPGRTPE